MTESPLSYINVSFSDYITKRKQDEAKHQINNIPDYAFPLDYTLHDKLNSIPMFESICKSITSTILTQEIESMNQVAVAVGPNQFPEIYQMVVDCAHRLGIGIPNTYILNYNEMNAYTIAVDDASPMIVLYSGLVERFQNHPGELKAVIAHECGHIHNNHSVYKSVINAMTNGFGNINRLVSGAAKLMMTQWTRATEVTADRAALICCDDPQDFIDSQATLLSGGMLNMDYKLNLDALRKQLEESTNNPTRIEEMFRDHPSGIRRIFLGEEFIKSDVLYSWRPEWKKPGMTVEPISKVNDRCKKIVNI